MKKLLVLFALVVLTATAAFAAEDISFAGSGGPDLAATELGGSAAGLYGGSGRATIGHVFSIGGGGYGTAFPIGGVAYSGDTSLSVAYGGLILGLYAPSFGPFRIGTEVLFGAGGATVEDTASATFGFYVIEPEARIEVAVLDWLHISTGVGYRFVLGLEAGSPLAPADLSGVIVPVGVRFGSF